jgi:hypothetical protein
MMKKTCRQCGGEMTLFLCQPTQQHPAYAHAIIPDYDRRIALWKCNDKACGFKEAESYRLFRK